MSLVQAYLSYLEMVLQLLPFNDRFSRLVS